MAVRKGIHHVAMNVRSLDETIQFYTEALGCTLIRQWPAGAPTAAMLDAGGAIIEIFSYAGDYAEGTAVIPHFALVSDDVDGDYASALAHGAKKHVEPNDVTIQSDPPKPVRIAFFVGINGELVELFQEK